MINKGKQTNISFYEQDSALHIFKQRILLQISKLFHKL